MSNVFDANTKKLLISPINSGDEFELGCTSWEKRSKNDLQKFQRPSLDGQPETRAQNLNQIEENHIFNVLINDAFIQESDINASVTTKEGLEQEIDAIFKKNTRCTVSYGHVSPTGYIMEYNVEEVSENDMSTFSITFTLLVAEPMSGGD